MDADSCSDMHMNPNQMMVLKEICIFTHKIDDTVSRRSVGKMHVD